MSQLPGSSQAAPFSDRPESTLHAVDSATRQLGDSVLQTSEDAVIAEGMPAPATEARNAARRLPTVAEGDDAIKRYVAANPGKAALMAASAGALVALLLGAQARRYRNTIDWSRVRVPHPGNPLAAVKAKFSRWR